MVASGENPPGAELDFEDGPVVVGTGGDGVDLEAGVVAVVAYLCPEELGTDPQVRYDKRLTADRTS